MLQKMSESERRFFEALKDIFIGAEIEGDSGYINLMKIKARYFDKVFESLKKDINEKLKVFPDFRKELFDKLYSFFKRYFSESGSIYFRHTPLHERVYEKVYTDREDVVLFYRTHMLYYVKTDIQPRTMSVEIEGFEFLFDVSELQQKKAWEKRQFVYELKKASNGNFVLRVLYSEKGRKTKVDEILRELKKNGIKNINEEILEKAFRVFEKQNEVDYFISKNARKFLKEQFDLWFYQYLFSDETHFTERRIKQLKTLQEISYKIIDFIAQFEDELLKIWSKPKFVLKSNYVITLDRIAEQEHGIKVIEKILKYTNFEKQFAEWKKLGIWNEGFNKKEILENTLKGKSLNPKYQFLPLDTRYFKDLENEILGLHDNLDESLDGLLIKSENWQALNAIMPKFRRKIRLIYIDPPFNTGSNEFTMYINRFLDSAWITMLENRLQFARDILSPDGSIYVRIDYHGNQYVRMIMDGIFGKQNFRNENIISRTKKVFEGANRFIVANDSLFFYSRARALNVIKKERKEQKWISAHSPGIRWSKVSKEYLKYYKAEHLKLKRGQHYSRCRVFQGKVYLPPEGRHWTFSQERLEEYEKQGRIRVDKKGILKYLTSLLETVDSDWTDIPGYVVPSRWGFPTENSEQLLQRVIEASSSKDDWVMDYFLGSATTTAVAHKLGRKWIGIEMGEHFYSVVLPRMKEVLAGKGKHEPSGISKEVKWKGGGFFRYYELEQYEDTLRRVKYEDADFFQKPGEDPYSQYIFFKDKKLLDALEIDYKDNKVKVDLSKLYGHIDVAETLSNLLGKSIKKFAPEEIEFEDGEKINPKDLDYKLIKPLIWW